MKIPEKSLLKALKIGQKTGWKLVREDQMGRECGTNIFGVLPISFCRVRGTQK
jgi:hypothetical protein